MRNLFLTFYFYLSHSKFQNRGNGFYFLCFSLSFSVYLIIQSAWKMYAVGFDWFNGVYLLIGLVLLVKTLYDGFSPSWNWHKSMKINFGYKSIAEYYRNNQT